MTRAATSDRRCPASRALSGGARSMPASKPSRDDPHVATANNDLLDDSFETSRSGNLCRGHPRAFEGESMPRAVLTLLAIALAVTIDVDIGAQILDQDHGQYSRADVEAGQRLYGPQCQVC